MKHEIGFAYSKDLTGLVFIKGWDKISIGEDFKKKDLATDENFIVLVITSDAPIKQYDEVLTSGGIRHVTELNDDGTFLDDGKVSGLPPSPSCLIDKYKKIVASNFKKLTPFQMISNDDLAEIVDYYNNNASFPEVELKMEDRCPGMCMKLAHDYSDEAECCTGVCEETEKYKTENEEVFVKFLFKERLKKFKEKYVNVVKEKNINVFEKIEEMADNGFICEILQDAAVEYDFVDGVADHNTAKPTGFGVAWRGCYSFFQKNGIYRQDDVGCYNPKDGGARRAFEELVKAYNIFIERDYIDRNALKETR